MKFPSLYRPGLLLTPVLLYVVFSLNYAKAFQDPRSRDPRPTPTPTPAPRTVRPTASQTKAKSGSGKSITAAVRTAQMTIIAPPGCRLWLNEVPVETSLSQEMTLLIDGQKVTSSERSAGVISLKGVRPDTYLLVARKANFQEYATPVTVSLDTENVFSVRLIPATGKLTVSPSVGGTDIEIISLDTNTTVGRYPERLDDFELAPGQYRVTASRAGYKPANREVRVNPGESVYLEPLLEPLPPPPPALKPRPVATPMSFTVQRQAKYLLFYLRGSSSDTTTTHGTITVSLNGPASNTVIGNLNGLPCHIELIRLENISEASVVEAPGPANYWSSMVLRVRLKDEKRRPISFAINWRALSNATAVKIDAASGDFISAQPIRKVQPEYPMTARGSNLGGSVLVILTIDTDGSVVSTKVVEGPDVFRRAAEAAARKWKFRPATRNGQAVESEQIIQFRFTP